MTTASSKHLIRGYHPILGFKYWYATDPNLPYAEYPSSDPSYPAIVPTNPYVDVVILDMPQGTGTATGESVDEEIPFSTTIQIPTEGDVVYVRNDGSTTGAASLATADATSSERCQAVGVATLRTDYVRTKGQIEINAIGVISAGDEVFLSSVTPGSVTATAPTAIGTAVVFIGIAVEDAAGGKCGVTLDIDRPDYIAS